MLLLKEVLDLASVCLMRPRAGILIELIATMIKKNEMSKVTPKNIAVPTI